MNFAHNKIMEESNLGLKICNQSVDHLPHSLGHLYTGYARSTP